MRKYKKNIKSVSLLNYHIIWCPKYRKNILVDKIKTRLETIIKEAIYEKRCEIIALEIMPNHVHLCVSAPPKIAPHKIVKIVKGRSSNYLRKEFPQLLKMPTLWSRSYFVATTGNVSTDIIMNYINNQWTELKKRGRKPNKNNNIENKDDNLEKNLIKLKQK